MRRLLNLAVPIVAILVIAAAFTVPLPGQAVSDDEIHFTYRPYVPQPENAIRVRTDLVEVPVVVRDSNGAVAKCLTKDDFEVYDQGRKRVISFFSVETAPHSNARETAPNLVLGPAPVPVAPAPARKPRYVAFYFDDFNMPLGDTVPSRDAAEKFVRESLEPGDRVGVFTSSTTITQDFTGDKQKLLDALSKIRTHLKKPQGAVACPNLTTYQAWLIMQFYDSRSDAFDLGIAQAIKCGACLRPSECRQIVLTTAQSTLAISEQFTEDTLGIVSDVIRYLGTMPGRRMLVLTSSGFMVQTTGPKIYQEKVIDAALHAGIVINTLDAKGLWVSVPGGSPSEWMDRITAGRLADYQNRLDDMTSEIEDDPLAAMAEGTGGRFFHNQNDLALGYRELVLEPEVSYVLGFSPDNINPDGKLRSLKVKLLNRKGLTVAARHGYYAPTKKDADALAAASAKRKKMDLAVLGNDVVTEVPARVNAERALSDGGVPGLRVIVRLDVHDLPFQRSPNRSAERLIFVAALFDQQDHFQGGVEGFMDLNLKDATLAQLSSQGLNANLSLQAPPGRYRLRQVVQEEATGRLAALNTPVEIH
ncbi:MAG TPA: VWA domain-containing protein [Candidatus Acidoferrales bacterium]|nr:VWA domain-containing protein [Candidatus Acidoferrales bacterium]